MRPLNRKTAPGVANGRVQKKNFDGTTHGYFTHAEPALVIERRRPGPGARHYLTVEDVRRFIALVPDWNDLAAGLRAIVLAPYDPSSYGRCYEEGVIELCAWKQDLWVEMARSYAERDRWLIELIGVETEPLPWCVLVKFTPGQARAWQLVGTLLHELGHHRDRMTTKRKREIANGEPYAERFNEELARRIWPAYARAFPL